MTALHSPVGEDTPSPWRGEGWGGGDLHQIPRDILGECRERGPKSCGRTEPIRSAAYGRSSDVASWMAFAFVGKLRSDHSSLISFASSDISSSSSMVGSMPNKKRRIQSARNGLSRKDIVSFGSGTMTCSRIPRALLRRVSNYCVPAVERHQSNLEAFTPSPPSPLQGEGACLPVCALVLARHSQANETAFA